VTLLARTHALLERKRISHALIGAAAMALRGVSRSTMDVDLLATDPSCLDAETWRTLRARVTIRRGDADDPLAGVVRIEATRERPLDVIVGRSAWQSDILARAEELRLGRVSLPVVTTADLVLLKLFAGGAQDRWDIEQILDGPERAVITGQVAKRIRSLPGRCARLFRSLR
jgi:hypothetical protein